MDLKVSCFFPWLSSSFIFETDLRINPKGTKKNFSKDVHSSAIYSSEKLDLKWFRF